MKVVSSLRTNTFAGQLASAASEALLPSKASQLQLHLPGSQSAHTIMLPSRMKTLPPMASSVANEEEAWMAMLSTISQRVTYERGDVIIVDGHRSEYIFRVVHGDVRVEKGAGTVLLHLQQGDVMGELSFLDSNMPPCASCVVHSDVAEVDRVAKTSLKQELLHQPHLAGGFFRFLSISLAKRLRAVARTAADAREAPSPQAAALTGHLRTQLTAKQLRRQRQRFGVRDSEALVSLFESVSTTMRGGLKVCGQVYVFEAHVAFSARVLALAHLEVVDLRDVSHATHDVERGEVHLHVDGAPRHSFHTEDSARLWYCVESTRQKLARNSDAGQVANGIDRRVSRYAADPHEAANRSRDDLSASASHNKDAGIRRGRATTRINEEVDGDATGSGPGEELAPRVSARFFQDGAEGSGDSEDDDDPTESPEEEVTEDAMRVLLQGAQSHSFSTGDVIVREDSCPNKLFQVARGTVSVVKSRTVMGLLQPVRVHSLQAGAYFCEMSLLSGDKASSSIIAESEAVELYSISAQFIEKTLKSDPTMLAPFFRHMATYLAQRIRLVSRLTGEAVDETLASVPFSEVVESEHQLRHFEAANHAEGWAPPELFGLIRDLRAAREASSSNAPRATRALSRIARRIHSSYAKPFLAERGAHLLSASSPCGNAGESSQRQHGPTGSLPLVSRPPRAGENDKERTDSVVGGLFPTMVDDDEFVLSPTNLRPARGRRVHHRPAQSPSGVGAPAGADASPPPECQPAAAAANGAQVHPHHDARSLMAVVLSALDRDQLDTLVSPDATAVSQATALAILLHEAEHKLEECAFAHFAASPFVHPLRQLRQRSATVPTVQDFALLRILGEGYEGKVLQARKRDCGVMYALKVLDKDMLASRSRRWRLHASNERRVLIKCDHPNIVTVAYCFQSPRYLYFALEYLPSTTLGRYIDKHNLVPVPVREIQFIAAQTVIALAHMHSRGMIYRDLKPANCLLDAQGHVRLVDMGMATVTDGELRQTVCGTQRYMAPEMRSKAKYDESVDWYSLGKLLLDFAGRSGRVEKHFRHGPLADLIDALLQKNPRARLGCSDRGVDEVQEHPFFSGVDWEALERKEVASPLNEAMYRLGVNEANSPHFKNGDDLNAVIEKLQHLKAGLEAEEGPGTVEDWDYVSGEAVYVEYHMSPFHDLRMCS